MQDEPLTNERLRRTQDLREIGVALHDLCQPLTTLQCRLEMAQLLETPDAYREAVATSLMECTRLARCVGKMREIVRRAAKDVPSEAGR